MHMLKSCSQHFSLNLRPAVDGMVKCHQFSCCCIFSPQSQEGIKKQRRSVRLKLQTVLYLKAYLKEGASLTTFLEQAEARQPFLLCIGEKKNKIRRFCIILDQKAILCKAQTSVAVFDGLFKAHYVFSLCDGALCNFYTFVQTTIYNIDVGRRAHLSRNFKHVCCSEMVELSL